jgi:hypothetical protein
MDPLLSELAMSLRDLNVRNFHTLRRQPLSEISGALGDLGTFLPILIALTVNKSISLSSTLIISGLFNIFIGIFFGIPLPVQPMKAVAAVAITRNFSISETMAAGLFVGACIFIFSVTGVLRWWASVIPIPVVKGIQMGAGMSLMIVAGSDMVSSLTWIGPSWADNYVWVMVMFVGLLFTNIHRHVPYALGVFLLGLVFAFVQLFLFDKGSRGFPSLEIWHPNFILPKGRDWRMGIVYAGIGQIPLTLLNSIIAVAHLAADLLPSAKVPSVTSLGLSIAGMNLVGCWFGTMPMCHGSGGLAAQHRFGARSGASLILLGILKLIIGLFFGGTIVNLLQRFPVAFLAVMVIGAGLELASVGESLNTTQARDLRRQTRQVSESRLDEAERKQRWTIMLVTTGFLVAFKNDAIGFQAGMFCYWSYKLHILLCQIQERWNEGRVQLSVTAGDTSTG